MMPGVVKIGVIKAELLPDMFRVAVICDKDELLNSAEWLHLADVGTLSEESSLSCCEFDSVTSLEFSSHQKIGIKSKIGFIIQDANNDLYIVGSAPPHCGKLTRTAQINQPSGKASVYYYSYKVPVSKFLL